MIQIIDSSSNLHFERVSSIHELNSQVESRKLKRTVISKFIPLLHSNLLK